MHIYKNASFSFFNKHFWSVDSKSAIHFFRRALENPDNPDKTQYPDHVRTAANNVAKSLPPPPILLENEAAAQSVNFGQSYRDIR